MLYLRYWALSRLYLYLTWFTTNQQSELVTTNMVARYIYIYIYIYIYLEKNSVNLSVYLSINLSTYPTCTYIYIYAKTISIYLSIHTHTRTHAHTHTCKYIYAMTIFFYPSIYTHTHIHTNTHIYIYIYIYIYSQNFSTFISSVLRQNNGKDSKILSLKSLYEWKLLWVEVFPCTSMKLLINIIIITTRQISKRNIYIYIYIYDK